MAPIPKKRRLANDSALTASLQFGQCPEFWEFTVLHTISTPCCERGTSNWRNTSTAEIWTFLGITILMGIKKLPSIKLYWSGDASVSVPTLPRYMSRLRFSTL